MKPYTINDYEMHTWYSAKDGCFLCAPFGFEAAMSDGKTPEQAIKNARESLRVCLEVCAEEGWHIPSPQKGKASKTLGEPNAFVHEAVKKTAARLFAQSGGRAKSPKKAAASARNGRLGGRPKKKAACLLAA